MKETEEMYTFDYWRDYAETDEEILYMALDNSCEGRNTWEDIWLWTKIFNRLNILFIKQLVNKGEKKI